MDALEFLKERRRMCDSYGDCVGCPLEEGKCVVSDVAPDEDYKRIVTAVEQWSKEHPRKTMQSVFLKQWPNCTMGRNGVVGICPRSVDKNYVCEFSECLDCRREFWMQEVE